MSKFRVIVADPPFKLDDELKMSDVKRGASSNYPVLDLEAIKNLEVKKLAAKDSLLVLWVPSAILQDGLDIMKNWGYSHKQTAIWVKTKKSPLKKIIKDFNKWKKQNKNSHELTLEDFILNFNLNDILGFNLGRMFRQTHEICLIGTKGKIYDKMKNRSQRSVHIHQSLNKHSQKPETLQDQLDIIFPKVKKLELFARRDRKGWVCVGNESPSFWGEDIRDSIERISKE